MNGRLLTAVVAVVFTLTGCGGQQAQDAETSAGTQPDAGTSPAGGSVGIPAGWYDVLDTQVAAAGPDVSDVPVISMGGTCELVDQLSIAGEAVNSHGSGVSTLGESGDRYVCEFTGPSTDLVLVHFEDPSELAAAREAVHAHEVPENEQTEQTFTVGGREVLVVRTSYPTNDTHIDYAATYVDEEHAGLVLLDVETT
jgi:nitrous oxide reductase accessory protein NosL